MVPVDALAWGAEDLGFFVVITWSLALGGVRWQHRYDQAMYTFWPFKKTTDSYTSGDDGLIREGHCLKGRLRCPDLGVGSVLK